MLQAGEVYGLLPEATSDPFVIGSSSATSAENFHGSLDEVQIYNYSHSHVGIRQLAGLLPDLTVVGGKQVWGDEHS